MRLCEGHCPFIPGSSKKMCSAWSPDLHPALAYPCSEEGWCYLGLLLYLQFPLFILLCHCHLFFSSFSFKEVCVCVCLSPFLQLVQDSLVMDDSAGPAWQSQCYLPIPFPSHNTSSYLMPHTDDLLCK